MANYCEICGKGTMSGMNVSHSHLKTKRTWKPNIQRVRAIVDGEVKRINVCTRCLRSGKVQRNAQFTIKRDDLGQVISFYYEPYTVSKGVRHHSRTPSFIHRIILYCA